MIKKFIWKTVGASVQGSSHLKVGTPCQDYFLTTFITPYTLCVAVADGAGSAAFSQIGARVACEGVVSHIELIIGEKGNIDKNDLLEVVTLTREQVVSLAKKEDRTPKEYASTLLILILTPLKAVWAHIGDGGIICKPANGNLIVLSFPEKGNYANETNFLTNDSFKNDLRVGELISDSGFDSAALFSDGIERLALEFESGKAYEPFFSPLFQHVRNNVTNDSLDEELEAFLSSERMSQKSDDDRTLVLIVKGTENNKDKAPEE